MANDITTNDLSELLKPENREAFLNEILNLLNKNNAWLEQVKLTLLAIYDLEKTFNDLNVTYKKAVSDCENSVKQNEQITSETKAELAKTAENFNKNYTEKMATINAEFSNQTEKLAATKEVLKTSENLNSEAQEQAAIAIEKYNSLINLSEQLNELQKHIDFEELNQNFTALEAQGDKITEIKELALTNAAAITQIITTIKAKDDEGESQTSQTEQGNTSGENSQTTEPTEKSGETTQENSGTSETTEPTSQTSGQN